MPPVALKSAPPYRTNGIEMPERIASRRSDEKTDAGDGCGAGGGLRIEAGGTKCASTEQKTLSNQLKNN